MKIKSESGEARYKQNIMAKYLTALAHEIRSDIDQSEEDREYSTVEYRQILNLQPDLAMARRDMAALQQKLKGLGELIVIFQAGRGPIKESRGNILTDPAMSAGINLALSTANLSAGVSIAAVLAGLKAAENPFPRFKRRQCNTKCLTVQVNNQQVTTTMLENIELTAIKNLDDNYSRLAGKFAASLVIKAAAAIGVGIATKAATDKLSGSSGLGSLVGTLAGAGTGAALFATIKPDLRCWHMLPANLQLARMKLKPGLHTVTVQYIGNNGGVLETKVVNVEIKEKERYFLNIRTTN
jgi:hypothetical protein